MYSERNTEEDTKKQALESKEHDNAMDQYYWLIPTTEVSEKTIQLNIDFAILKPKIW